MVCGHCLVTVSFTINQTLKGSRCRPSECRSHSGGDSVATGYNLPHPPPPYPLPPSFSPSLISLTVSVDVKHRVYVLTNVVRKEVWSSVRSWSSVRGFTVYVPSFLLPGVLQYNHLPLLPLPPPPPPPPHHSLSSCRPHCL